MRREIRNNKFDIAIGIFFVASFFCLLYGVFINPYGYPRGKFAMLGGCSFLLIWGGLCYIQLVPALIRRQHLMASQKMEVTLEIKNSMLIKGEFGQELITHENLKYVDLFYSWNTNPYSSDLEYAKLELTSGKQFLIPGRSVDLSRLEQTFRKKIRTVKTRFMNRLR